jgi:hypothetical protein
MSHRRKRRVHQTKSAEHGDLTNVERVFEELRQIQWQTNCSSTTLQTFLTALRGKLGRLVSEIDDLPATVKYGDKKMQSMVCLLCELLFSIPMSCKAMSCKTMSCKKIQNNANQYKAIPCKSIPCKTIRNNVNAMQNNVNAMQSNTKQCQCHAKQYHAKQYETMPMSCKTIQTFRPQISHTTNSFSCMTNYINDITTMSINAKQCPAK